jgi:hypothetical protein
MMVAIIIEEMKLSYGFIDGASKEEALRKRSQMVPFWGSDRSTVESANVFGRASHDDCDSGRGMLQNAASTSLSGCLPNSAVC